MAANGDQTKDIDSRILKILGLSDAVDLEYGEYKTLLKEKMLAQRMQGGGDSGDAKLITDEYKSIKNERGKFKARSVGNAKDFVSGKKGGSSATHRPQRDSSKLLPGSGGGALSTAINLEEEVGEESEAEDFMRNVVAPSLSKIEESLENILNSFKKQQDLDEKASEKDRVGEEKDKKKEREAKLESKDGPIKKTLDIVSKPVKGFFDMIWDFLKNVLLGGALLKLVDIFKNPSAFFDPIIDFANGVIGFLNLVIDILSQSMLWPINLALTALNLGIKGIEGAINGVLGLFGSDDSVDLGEGYKPIAFPNIPTIPSYDEMFKAEEGGEIDGPSHSQGGVNINAEGGEIVMSNKSGDYWGRDNLLAMNSMAGSNGGAANLGFAKDGGIVLGAGHSPSENNALKGIPIGSDGRYVQGTSSQPGGKGVAEWEATRHLVKTLKQLVPNSPIAGMTSFENITAWKGDKGLRGVPSRVESQSGTQFVDLHFDARGGRSGVLLPEGKGSKVSGIDRALMAAFGGEYPGSDLAEKIKGVQGAGGTILELAAIDDPSIGKFLGETQSGRIGPESKSLANKVINALSSGVSSGGNSTSTATNVGKQSPTTSVPRPPGPSGGGGGGGNTTVIGGGKQQGGASSGSSASQKSTPSISSQDINNAELIVIKSIYNIIG